MPFTHFRMVGTQNQGDMSEKRFFKTQRFVYQQLTRCIGQVFFRTDHMRDMHQAVVNHDRIIISRNSIGFYDNKVADTVGVKFYITANQIVYHDFFVPGHPQTDRRPAALRLISLYLLRRQMGTFSHITGHLPVRDQVLAFGFQLFRRTIAIIGLAFRQQLIRIFFINVQTLRLMVRSVGSSHIGAFVPVHAQPTQSFFNVFFRLRRRTFPIRIFNAQDQLASGFTGQQPVKQRAARAAYMKWPCRAGRKTNSYFFCHLNNPSKIFL